MKPYLVIDGYNLLYEIAKAEHLNLQQFDLEESRDRLIERVGNYSALKGYETHLVFDAWSSSDRLSEEIQSGITVVYTDQGQTADTYIESYLYQKPKNAKVHLVTSDALVQVMALFTGAERISSREFLQRLKIAEEGQKDYDKREDIKRDNSISSYLDEDLKERFERMRRGDFS